MLPQRSALFAVEFWHLHEVEVQMAEFAPLLTYLEVLLMSKIIKKQTGWTPNTTLLTSRPQDQTTESQAGATAKRLLPEQNPTTTGISVLFMSWEKLTAARYYFFFLKFWDLKLWKCMLWISSRKQKEIYEKSGFLFGLNFLWLTGITLGIRIFYRFSSF